MLLAVLLMAGCKTKEKVVETRTVDTVRTVALRYDSVYVHDSVFVREYMRGDTVFVDKDRWHTLYKDAWRRDTVYVSKDKYIRYTVKEKQPWWDSVWIKISTAITMVLLTLLLVAWMLYRVNFFRSRSEGGEDKE